MSYEYEYCVFIGRFQPLHNGHIDVLSKAISIAKKVIVLVGSSFQPRTIKNPFTFIERRAMFYDVRNQLMPEQDLIILPLGDQPYNDQKWAKDVQQVVQHEIWRDGWQDKTPSVAIIGHTKDESSYYLQMFPQWEQIEYALSYSMNATDIRKILFGNMHIDFMSKVVPHTTFEFLKDFVKTTEFETLKKENQYIKEYKDSWKAAPYPPTFVTTDAVVIKSGHVLLIKRNAQPGKGLWALPGGFLNQNETIVDGMVRELMEETRIKIGPAVIRGSVVNQKVFDKPDRSFRGRTLTHAYLIELLNGPLPKVKGSDDASEAKWFSLSEVKEEMMFEDHFHIIQEMMGRAK